MINKFFITGGGCLLFFSALLEAQPTVQDCLGAIPVSSNIIVQANAYSGTGFFPNEITYPISCLQSGEKNDVWYSISTYDTGYFLFSITPINPMDDFDWAIFDITNHSCADIATVPGLQVACNYAGNNGGGGITGTAGGGTAQQTSAPFFTQSNHIYVLNVSNYSANQSGYTLTFQAATAVNQSELCTGTIYKDTNSNCMIDTGEYFFQFWRVNVDSLNYFLLSDENGYYQGSLPPGNNTLSLFPKKYYTVDCPVAPNYYSLTLNQPGDTISGLNFSFAPISTVHDLNLSIFGANPRPGLAGEYSLFYFNPGTVDETGQVKMFLDTNLQFNYATPPNDAISGDTIIWNFNLQTDKFDRIKINYSCATVLPGTPISTFAWIEPFVSDSTPFDNADTSFGVVVNSYDPNLKMVDPAGFGPQGLISPQQELRYTIMFQNTGTAAAYKVIVTDSLDPDLDKNTFEVIAASHPVRVSYFNGMLHFDFSPIVLPDSNSNEPESHGFVRYKIKPAGNIAPGTEISNYASIYFDSNVPVITNTILNTIITTQTVSELNYPAGSPVLIPNPFSETTILYIPGKNSNYRISVYDISGRLMETRIVSETQVQLSKGNKPMGIYFVEIENLCLSTKFHLKFIIL